MIKLLYLLCIRNHAVAQCEYVCNQRFCSAHLLCYRKQEMFPREEKRKGFFFAKKFHFFGAKNVLKTKLLKKFFVFYHVVLL